MTAGKEESLKRGKTDIPETAISLFKHPPFILGDCIAVEPIDKKWFINSIGGDTGS